MHEKCVVYLLVAFDNGFKEGGRRMLKLRKTIKCL